MVIEALVQVLVRFLGRRHGDTLLERDKNK